MGEQDSLKTLERENRELRRANEILKSAAAFLGAELDHRPDDRLHLRLQGPLWVEPICRVLPIAPSTYYQASRRPASARAIRDAKLKSEIARVHAEHFGVYGARKLWRQLHREGVGAARCTVERLMGELGLEGVRRGKPRRTTTPDAAAPRPADLVERDFSATRPTSSGLPTSPMWPPGRALSMWPWSLMPSAASSWVGRLRGRCAPDLALDALEMAIWRRQAQLDGLVHHSTGAANICRSATPKGWPRPGR